ncbi:MAG: DNA alkylation repair protein [Rickettsiales bacterium]|jgi:3-methyladenine DNA glycosylase AlkD|nr:DNA alkylation repair protein [Rickettsiales bacterium]
MDLVDTLEKDLLAFSSEERKNSMGRFFREEIHPYGVDSARVKKIGKNILVALKGRPKSEVFSLCEELWKSGRLEKCELACELAYALRKSYTPDDFYTLEYWIAQFVSNWANCDSLCNHSVGAFIEMYPEFIERLKSWTRSKNRWQKRASAVSLIIPARRGKFLSDILSIAEALLQDRDDMVQKGYGWLLKVASEAHPDEIFDYLMAKRDIMPRIAFRYAVEKLPQELRKIAMERRQ